MADLSLDVHIEAGDWQAAEITLNDFISQTLNAALKLADGHETSAVEVSVLLTDDAHQQVLNQHWRGKDKSTNVLSFPADETEPFPGEALLLGDISLAYETVALEAQDQQKSFSDHLRHLLVHGLLHLLGYDHEDNQQAHDMETLEVEILKTLGQPSPYAARP